jgi:hypothetical protein
MQPYVARLEKTLSEEGAIRFGIFSERIIVALQDVLQRGRVLHDRLVKSRQIIVLRLWLHTPYYALPVRLFKHGYPNNTIVKGCTFTTPS